MTRTFQKDRFILAFLLATAVFVIGVFIGNLINDEKLDRLDEITQSVQLQTLGTELQFTLIEDNICDYLNTSKLADELYQIGSRLDFMENELGSTDPQVLIQKEYYHLLEIRHWHLLRKASSECNQSIDWILYFYSNKGDCSDCQEQGGVLTYLREKDPQLYVYSFDTNIDNPALDFIKDVYGVDDTLPHLVVNDNVHKGFMTRQIYDELAS